jgi:hypothetical protein
MRGGLGVEGLVFLRILIGVNCRIIIMCSSRVGAALAANDWQVLIETPPFLYLQEVVGDGESWC